MRRRRSALVLAAATPLLAASWSAAQTIGPDCISSDHVDVARNGTNAAGTITGYSIGAVTCNHGDMPMLVQVGNTVRPHMGQGMYRLKTYTAAAGGTYQRFEEIGQGWVKRVGLPVGGTGAGCGACQAPAPANHSGVNCGDTYSSAFNTPSAMSPRIRLNPTSGQHLSTTGGGTDEASINTRIQVATSDVTAQPINTRFFVESVHLLPDDAGYVRPGQTVAVNAMNNAASQEININGGTSNPTLLGAGNRQVPAIVRWSELESGVTLVTADHDDTPNPDPRFPGTFIRSRFYIGGKATAIGFGRWRYEYAVFNLNSDRAAAGFAVPLGSVAALSDINFRHPLAHSGDPVSNAPWTSARAGTSLSFTTQSFAEDPNANAIRWGTMYNFGFTADVPPMTGPAVLTLFKPGAIRTLVVAGLPVPAACIPDVNADRALTADDVIAYLNAFFNNNLTMADVATLGGLPMPDSQLTADDLILFLSAFFAGC